MKIKVTPMLPNGRPYFNAHSERSGIPRPEHGSTSAAYLIGDVVNQAMENVRVSEYMSTGKFKDPLKYRYLVQFTEER